MKKNFTFIVTALVLSIGISVMRAQSPESGTILWAESWDNGTANATPSDYLNSEDNTTVVYNNAVITYTSTDTDTKLNNNHLAGGDAPELLLVKNDTWAIDSIPTGNASALTLSFKNNNAKASVTSPTEGITIIASTSKDTYTYTIINEGNETFTLVFSASSNTRLDDIELTVAPKYTIVTAEDIEHGSISLSSNDAAAGETVTVFVTPEEGYCLATLFYTYGETVTDIDIFSKQFTMPAANITVGATFAELPEAYFAPVTEDTDDWSGQYIMAYRMDEDKLYALNAITKVGSNFIGDTLNIIDYVNNNGLIEINGETTSIHIDIEPSENGYTLKLNNGYLGWLSGNTLVAADSITPNYEWTLGFANGKMSIVNVADNDRLIKFNTSNPRFAAYSATSTVQTLVCLYRYHGPSIVDETYTLTVADIENGTVELSDYEAIEGSLVTVTATPDEGYVLESLTYAYDETTTDIDLVTMSFIMPAANVTVSATFVEEAEIPVITNEILPIYIQGNDGTNNNRLPYAYQVTISNLTPEATYRYMNQVVVANDNANYDGVGNMIFANCEGDFIRTTNGNLNTEGHYSEFTANENGEYTGWFITEATSNNRFMPGNQVYMRICINDGNEGTTAKHKMTTSDYATVINFGTENEATQGTAIVGKTQENGKNFVFLFADEGQRPIYGTTIESTGVDYSAVSQYASFYQNQVSGNSGFWGGIIPNVNDNGIQFVGIYDNCTGEAITIMESEEDGVWDGINTANPSGGTSNVIFIDFTTLGVKEAESSITVWNRSNEIIVETAENDSYRMTVYNTLGQPVISRNINGAGSHTVSHNLSNGLYIINLSNNGNNFSTKIVVR